MLVARVRAFHGGKRTIVLDPDDLVESSQDRGFGLFVEIWVLDYGAEEEVHNVA